MRSLAQSTTPFLTSGKAKNGVFSLRIAHIALFYTINFFFSDSPEGFALLLGQCAALRSLAQPCAVNNTFFNLWEGQKWGFFAKDRTYRAFLHNKLFFSDSPEGFALLLGQCAALRSLAQSTTPFLTSGKAKNGVFSLRIAHIAPSLCFCTKGIFFGWSQRD